MKKNSYEKILTAFGGIFLVFCIFSVLFGEIAAIWIFRIAAIFLLLGAGVFLFFFGKLKYVEIIEKSELARKKREIDLQNLITAQKKAAIKIHQSQNGNGGFLIDLTGEKPAIVPLSFSPEKKTAIPGRYQPETGKVLKVLEKALTVVIIGPQGTGKTTLLQHIISQNRNLGENIIIDPHGFPDKYLPDMPIAGTGRNYVEIQRVMESVIATLNTRYEMYTGQDFKPIFVYIDELTLLSEKVSIFQEFMRCMLTESRKVGIRLFACVHSDRVKILGLEGAGDLADGVTWVRLRKSHDNQRWADVVFPDGQQRRCSLPGIFRPPKILTANDRKVLEYIEKNTPCRRGKLLASRILPGGTLEYDAAVEKLIQSRKISVEEAPKKNDWKYIF
jgi:hypothetical protein